MLSGIKDTLNGDPEVSGDQLREKFWLGPVIQHSANVWKEEGITKSGIRLKREIWTRAGMRTRIAQVAERRARNPEVRGSNPGSGSSFFLEIL